MERDEKMEMCVRIKNLPMQPEIHKELLEDTSQNIGSVRGIRLVWDRDEEKSTNSMAVAYVYFWQEYPYAKWAVQRYDGYWYNCTRRLSAQIQITVRQGFREVTEPNGVAMVIERCSVYKHNIQRDYRYVFPSDKKSITSQLIRAEQQKCEVEKESSNDNNNEKNFIDDNSDKDKIKVEGNNNVDNGLSDDNNSVDKELNTSELDSDEASHSDKITVISALTHVEAEGGVQQRSGQNSMFASLTSRFFGRRSLE